MTIRIGPTAFAAAALALLALTLIAADGAYRTVEAETMTTTIRWGPYAVPAAMSGMPGTTDNMADFDPEKPCSDCYLTQIIPNLVYEDGTTVDFSTGGMLHHMVLFNFSGDDATCGPGTLIGNLGERVFASGNERSGNPFPSGYGYYVAPDDTWLLIVDLMNMTPEPKDMYLEFTFSYRPGSDDVKPLTPIWLDVNNCDSSEFEVPMGYSDTHWDWVSDREGDIIGMGGHVHDFGISVAAENVNEGYYVCTSVAGYASGSSYAPAAVPGADVGHPGWARVLVPGNPEYNGHIEDMTGCAGHRVRAGDTIRLHTQYVAPPDMMMMHGVMGIMIAYMHETTDPPDFDGDGMTDDDDNCMAWPNPTQSMPPWSVPAGDPDCDGFQTYQEQMIGTLAMVQCPADTIPNNEHPDAWPPDADDDGDVDVGDIVSLFGGGILMDPAAYRSRSDLAPDGQINVGDIITGFGGGKILSTCG